MEKNNEYYQSLKELAALFFTPQEIAIMLGVDDYDAFRILCLTPGTNEYNNFHAGRLEQDMLLRKSILTLARQGSSPAQTMAKNILDNSAAKMLDR